MGLKPVTKMIFVLFEGARLQPEVQARMELFLAAYQPGMNFQKTPSIWMKIGETKVEQDRFL